MKKKVIGCMLLIAIAPSVLFCKANAMTEVNDEVNYEEIAFEEFENDLEDNLSLLSIDISANKVSEIRFYYKKVPQKAWGSTVDTLGKVVDVSSNIISKFTDRDSGVSIQPKYNLSGYGYTTSGGIVKETQKLLVLNGYSVDQDGYWGPKTCTATKQFQGQRGLVADGIVGYNTWTALFGK